MTRILIALFVLVPSLAFAQNPDSYRLNYYNQGAPQPLQQSDVFPASAAVCNLEAPANPVNINPTTAVWDDPANPGRVCAFTVGAGGALLSFPVGNYEATLTAINSAGQAESARAPFSRMAAPPVRTGLRLYRP